MNKKGGGIMTFLTYSLVMGIIAFIVFAIWGSSGGFGSIVEIGKFMAKIPAWVYVVIGVAWLFMKMGGK